MLIVNIVMTSDDDQVLSQNQLEKLLENFDGHQLASILDEIVQQYENEHNHSSSAKISEIVEKVNKYPELYNTENLGKIFENLMDVLKPKIESEL